MGKVPGSSYATSPPRVSPSGQIIVLCTERARGCGDSFRFAPSGFRFMCSPAGPLLQGSSEGGRTGSAKPGAKFFQPYRDLWKLISQRCGARNRPPGST